MGPKKAAKGKGKGKGKGKAEEGPSGPTPAELLAQIEVLNAQKAQEELHRNTMQLERVDLLYSQKTVFLRILH